MNESTVAFVTVVLGMNTVTGKVQADQLLLALGYM